MHVHGKFPPLAQRVDHQTILHAQKAIRYIEDGGDTETVELARSALSGAEHIIAVGFDFDQQNCRLLELEKHADRIHALNYDGNEALSNRLKQLGVKAENVVSGSFGLGNELGVSKASSRGFFDRPELLKGASFWELGTGK